MTKKELYACVFAYFERIMPPQDTELTYNNPFQLLVAVMLSAQCTDKRINQVTPRLFHDYPVAEALAESTPETVYEYIRSVSYPNSKAKHLVAMAQLLMTKHGGNVPSTREELVALPGVGRKTANVVQAIIFGKETLAVDTHVFRVSHRLALVPKRCTTPLSVELELLKHVPEGHKAAAHFWLLYHGRYTCTARSPRCEACELKTVCAEYRHRNGAK